MSERLEAAMRRWQQCPRAFWLDHHRPAPSLPEPELADDVVRGGSSREAVTHSFPGSVLIDTPDFAAAQAQTEQALAATERRPIIGAAFMGPCDTPVRIDLLVPISGGRWRVVLLRYATVSDVLAVDVLALCAQAARDAGFNTAGLDLALIDTEFIYPGYSCYAGLFRQVDVTDMAARSAAIGDALRSWQDACASLLKPEPHCVTSEHCDRPQRCRHWDYCRSLEDHSGEAEAARYRLDLLGRDLAVELRQEGHVDLRSVPESSLPTPRTLHIQRAALSGLPQLDAEAAELLAAAPYPHHFLRFETIGFAVPIWPATRPYEVLPFMWTCDVQAAPGSEVQHHRYLADASGDPRRAFAQSLLKALGGGGTIFAYNAGFERNRIRELAKLFDDLSVQLDALLPRIVDLFQVVRAHYYHPAMQGSWSAKSVFNAVAPDVQVERFDVGGVPSGLSPLEAFALALRRDTAPARVAQLREALQDYGQRQTLALRRLAQTLRGAA
jgi:hypothetical protein